MSSYNINKDDLILHLSEKIKKITKAYEELKLSYKGHKIQNEELKIALKKSKKSAHFAIEKEAFLKERIVKVYGRSALKEILNDINCPAGFDSSQFDKCTEKSFPVSSANKTEINMNQDFK